MKKILSFAFGILCAIYFIGCGDNTVTTNSSGNVTPTISGRIENWNLGSNKKLYAETYNGDTGMLSVVLDSCVIDNAGNFTIRLDMPPDSELSLFKLDTMCTHHTIINPTNLRFCYLHFYAEDSIHSYLGTVYRSNDSSATPHSGKTYCDPFYFNSSGSISGTDSCASIGMIIETFSIAQSKGWNSVYLIYDSLLNNITKVTLTTQMHTVQWYLRRYFGDITADKFHERKRLVKRD